MKYIIAARYQKTSRYIFIALSNKLGPHIKEDYIIDNRQEVVENHGHPHHEGTWYMKEDYNIMELGMTQVLVRYGICVNINLENTSTSHNIRIFFNIFRGKSGSYLPSNTVYSQ